MTAIAIQGGFYDDALHRYTSQDGKFVPSITQILHLCGFNSYDGVARDVMEAAAERGSKVHAICWSLAKYGDYDPSWGSEELDGYIAAYKKAVHELGFIADKDWVESPVIAEYGGMKFGCTADVIGAIKPWPWIIELKTTAQESKAWAIQTMAQAIGRFNCRAESAKRMAIMLKKDGSYRCCVHENAAYDKSVFLAALTCVYWRINAGQKLECE
jgi:hypothetical protein